MSVCMHVYIYIYACTYVRMCVCVRVLVCMYVFTHVCMHVSMYVRANGVRVWVHVSMSV